ncbi:MAG: ABC transporter, permease protein 2 (cluster 1, maltose/g3p/polyamine/iron), partial [uncultured Arthrobacter sp.]
PADPEVVHVRELPHRLAGGSARTVAGQHRARHGARRHHRHHLQCPGGVGLRVLPVPGPQCAVRPGPGDHDAPRRGHHDSDLPDLEQPGPGRHAHPALGGQPLRQRVLHLPAAPVLPGAAARAVRGRPGGRGEQLAHVLAHRAAAVQARPRRHPAVRVPGGLDGPDAPPDLPAGQFDLHRPPRAEGAARSVRVRRGLALGTGGDGERDHHGADDHPLLYRPAALRRGDRHHGQQGL